MSRARLARWEGQDGTGYESFGTLCLIDGEFYVEELPVSEGLEQFAGRYCEVCYFFPEHIPDDYRIDPPIWPLVEALNQVGVRTVSSCGGHLTPDIGAGQRAHPYVWAVMSDWRKHLAGFPLSGDWELRGPTGKLTYLYITLEATTLEELEALQASACELATRIRATLAG